MEPIRGGVRSERRSKIEQDRNSAEVVHFSSQTTEMKKQIIGENCEN